MEMTTPPTDDLRARLRILANDYPVGSIHHNTVEQAIAALSALPAAVGEWSGLASRKLDELRTQGWAINGYALYRNGERGLIDLHGAVHWLPAAPAATPAQENE